MPGTALLFTAAGAGSFAVDLVVLLATAALVGTVLRRLRLEAIPGYVIAGALVGPHALGLVQADESLKEMRDLAVVLLMFGIGMHLDVGHMRRGLVHIVGVGVISTLVFVVAAAAILAPWGGVSTPEALVVAMAMSMSSTAVLVRILMARREGRTIHGRVTLGIAIVQDFAVVVVMALIPPIAEWASHNGLGAVPGTPATLPTWVRFVVAAAIGLGGVAAMLMAGILILPRVLHIVAKAGSSELMLVASAAIALAAAVGT